MPEYSILDLAKLADVTPRTVRYYVAQGLLPSPDPQGPRTTYTDEHLQRLLAIKRLQAAHLPLAEIRTRLGVMDPAEVSEIAEAPTTNAVRESAAEYVQRVLATGPRPADMPARSVAPPVPSVTLWKETTEPDRSQWDRVDITPDIEIHVRRPMTRTDNKRVARLIEYARQLFREEK